jgi:NADH-quinone oxidoreductase subunit A
MPHISLLDSYFSILIFLVVSLGLSLVILGLSYLLASQKSDTEKLSAYECGFDPFDDARSTFDVRFYLVAILFIIFDLEVSFLFPWCVTLGQLPLFGFWSMMVFLLILTVGFVYEWQKGALDWE